MGDLPPYRPTRPVRQITAKSPDDPMARSPDNPPMLLSRTIHFNAGRSLWRKNWSAEKNRAVYGDEGPHGYGHNYLLEVSVEGRIDPETSMIVNLTDLDRLLKEEVDLPLDHRNLNQDVPDFADRPPTAENLAVWIWK